MTGSRQLGEHSRYKAKLIRITGTKHRNRRMITGYKAAGTGSIRHTGQTIKASDGNYLLGFAGY